MTMTEPTLVFATQIPDGPLGICEQGCLISCSRILKRSGSGVFLCIRCSGIHRGMGTHISKVKSVDLDVWTPEQMEVWSIPFIINKCSRFIQSIEKWGNRLANLYWEAHLKAGHIPPEQCVIEFSLSRPWMFELLTLQQVRILYTVKI